MDKFFLCFEEQLALQFVKRLDDFIFGHEHELLKSSEHREQVCYNGLSRPDKEVAGMHQLLYGPEHFFDLPVLLFEGLEHIAACCF
jgi:hypothetical protein